jgi:hypothetical protein
MDDEALSWFVDNESRASCWPCAASARSTAWAASPRDPRRARSAALQALGATAADISRQLRQVQTESAGGRADIGGGEQPVRTLATVQTAREIGAAADRARRRPQHQAADVAEVSDTIAEQRARPC